MPRYMVIRKASALTEGDDMPGPGLMEAMDAYIQEMIDAGVHISGDGLKPSREGVRVNFKDGEPRVIDGPFAETKELVAGFSIIECASTEEAIEWLKRWPKLDDDGNVELELRPMYEPGDFEQSATSTRSKKMKFMVLMGASAASEAGQMPSTEALTAMGEFNEELVKAGVMIAGEGLHPTSNGARVEFGGAEPQVVDGPFAESKEMIAGFWIWDVKSLDEAKEWARRIPNTDGEHGRVEIRQVFEADDFGENLTPELREREAALRAQVENG